MAEAAVQITESKKKQKQCSVIGGRVMQKKKTSLFLSPGNI
jgi:hypothetical protein